MLDDVTLYWLTNTATSAARLYWETAGEASFSPPRRRPRRSRFPSPSPCSRTRVYRAPETWARRAYRNLIYFNEVDKGGHFAAWEQPALFSGEVAAAFRPLRQN